MIISDNLLLRYLEPQYVVISTRTSWNGCEQTTLIFRTWIQLFILLFYWLCAHDLYELEINYFLCFCIDMVAFYFFYSHSGWWNPYWFHSARRPLNGLLYLPRVIFFIISGVGLSPLGTAATSGLLYKCPGWLWWWIIWWNEDWQGKPKYSEKTCPSATLSTTNPTLPGSNPGHRGGKPATNRLSYGAAWIR
jgi:hypothetical protein